VFKGLKYRCG